MVAHCPTSAQLESLSLGQLPEEQSDALIHHLGSCDSCQNELAQIDSSEDSLIAQLRSSTTDTEEDFANADGCRVAMTRALAALAMVPDHVSPDNALVPEKIGDYEIVRPLGHGGMGHVFLGKHMKLGRMVAIKLLADHRRWDQTMRERFESEMRLIGGLKHPNIVSAYDAREVDGLAVLVTEFIDGMTLSDILKRTGKISVANASKIVRDVCEALQYIQTKGLVHRDIKPSNIMIDQDGSVKLLDLGLARIEQNTEATSHFAATEFTATGQAMGTADYIPPEQINDGRNVDIRADIYGLGCTFYKLLTGKAPFADHSSVYSKMNAHVSEAPVSLKTNKNIPVKIANLVDSMLAKEPANRPQQPSDVADKLTAFGSDADLREVVVKAQALPVKPFYETETTFEQPEPQGSFFSRIPWTTLIAASAAGLFGFLLGITVAVKKPDGSMAQVEIPTGSTAVVDAEGNIEVRLAGSENSARIDNSDVEHRIGAAKTPKAEKLVPVETEFAPLYDKQKFGVAFIQPTGGVDGGAHWATVGYRLPESSEIYHRAEPGDFLDILAVNQGSAGSHEPYAKLIAAKIKVREIDDSNLLTFLLSDTRELMELKRTDPELKNIRFRFSKSPSQLVIDRAKLNGVWSSVFFKMRGEEVKLADPQVHLFHKNQQVICGYGIPAAFEFKLEEGVIEAVANSKGGTVGSVKNSRLKYRFLESGRLELFDPVQDMLIRLEKVDEPKSKDEKIVFDILAKATENPDYFQAFIVEPTDASDPVARLVSGTKEYVKLVGKPIINKNHILSIKVVDDEKKRPSLGIQLTAEGGERMAWATKKNIRKQIALIIDGTVKTAPTINGEVSHTISLTGTFTKGELDSIATELSSKLDVSKYHRQFRKDAKAAKRPAKRKRVTKVISHTPLEKKIGKLVLAMHRYERDHLKFPVSKCRDEQSDPPYSWRVAVLPYLGHQDLFDEYKFDEPWDSEANSKVLKQMPDAFKSPSSPNGSTETGYVGIAGKRAVLGIDKPKGFKNFTDGSSNSICVIESKAGIPWTKPEDLVIDSLEWESQAQFEKAFSDLGFLDKESACVGFADGSTHLLNLKKVRSEVKQANQRAPGWMNLFTIDDGQVVDYPDYLLHKEKED